MKETETYGPRRIEIHLPSPELLTLARAWKLGKLRPVHPEIGRLMNQALVRVGEDAVPFRRATNPNAPTIIELIRAEYERAAHVQDEHKTAA